MTALEVVPDVSAHLDVVDDPAAYVETCLSRGKEWLESCVEHGDLNAITNLKGFAETMRVATMQKQLGKDAELAATELVRRAERAIGKGIRKGQEEGQIRPSKGNQRGDNTSVVSAFDYVAEHEWRAGPHQADIRDLTDDISDDEFDSAIAEAKAEQNLSRQNVARKTGKVAERPKPKRPEHLRKTRRFDPNRAIEATVTNSVGIEDDLWDLMDWTAVDLNEVDRWVSSLELNIKSLHKLRRQLKELTHDQ